jgi:hypothetical protein
MIYSRQVILGLFLLNVIVAGLFSYVDAEDSGKAAVAVVAAVPEKSELLLLSEVAQPEHNLRLAPKGGSGPQAAGAPAGEEEAGEEEAGEEEAGEEQTAAVRACRVWGPRKSAEAFAELAQALNEVGGFPEVVAVEVEAAPTYMVYVDGQTRARQIMQELKAVKVDNFRIQRDEGDIISVGVFSRRLLADRQLARVRELGYPAYVQVMERSQTVYNLQAYVDRTSALYAQSSQDCRNSVSEQVSQRSLR